MTANAFGGGWTQDKLDVLGKYLAFYCKALADKNFNLIYIDAFAGTGRCRIRDRTGEGRLIEGSAKIALDCAPGFHQYHFIEKKRKHQRELQELIDRHPNGHRAAIEGREAADVLPMLLRGYDWQDHRGVLFLDPFGLQCNWQMLRQIAATHALDVFFLVSLSGLFRQAARDAADIDESKAAILTNFLGTDQWRTALYTRSQTDMFSDDPQVTREAGWHRILEFVTGRLESIFAYVAEPRLLGAQKGPPLFALYFAVANPSNSAVKLAKKVSSDILKKMPS